MKYKFPEHFIWGSATAATQIEGAAAKGGKGPSVWDVFCKEHPELIWQQATPEIACDHYHRYREDVALIKAMGHNGYRLSIAWPRIYPVGTGELDPEGVDFYNRLFDALLENGIQPNVTLYHWDMPNALAMRGGWENKETIDAYVRYADTCFRLFGDRVKLWSTFNEPGWNTLNGYVTGLHPPLKFDYRAAIQVAHNILVAHTRVVQSYHRLEQGGQIGLVLNMAAIYPATDSYEDKEAAEIADGLLTRWFIDPVLLGRYPQDALDLYAKCNLLPDATEEELALFAAGTVDFIGVNYYFPEYASATAEETSFHLNKSGRRDEAGKFSIKGLFKFVKNPKGSYTDWGWGIYPEGLYDLLVRADRYRKGLPIYITENGIGLNEQLQSGTVEDQARIDFVREHLQMVHRAISEGINVKGYYMWSLMDNFSWYNGYKKRYGFLYIDRDTLQRFRKKSSYWFQQVAENHGF